MAERGVEEGQWMDRENGKWESEDINNIKKPIYVYRYTGFLYRRKNKEL